MKNKKIIEDAIVENERIGKLLEKEKKENIERSREFIREFLKQFPKDTESWGKATDELPDLHKWMSNRYNEDAPAKPYRFDFENKSWTPSVRNTRHRDGIEKLLDLMDDKQIADVNERFRNWFRRSVVTEPITGRGATAEEEESSKSMKDYKPTHPLSPAASGTKTNNMKTIKELSEELKISEEKIQAIRDLYLLSEVNKEDSVKFIGKAMNITEQGVSQILDGLDRGVEYAAASGGLDVKKFDDEILEAEFNRINKERMEEGSEPLSVEKFLKRKKEYEEAKKEISEKSKMLVYCKSKTLMGKIYNRPAEEIEVSSDNAEKIKSLTDDGYILKKKS